ncbi:uncharacterized protein LOC113348947 [Papaver somniferum]|uniref:uncharacterized protein LOC113348947 n=1 Tax=Papaver somniferum TaxID=3469 RepID=UPI000E704627|nr:uncharacterized protein LOC113348947 [Papaver somniferum]
MKLISDLNKPWIILGDFNAVISQDEKVGGRLPNRTAMLDFNECINQCELLPAPKNGLQFSWSNCQQVFGNVQVKIKEAEERVQAATEISDNNPFDEDALNELVQAQNEHASREIRNARNTINEIEDDDGNVLASRDLIAQYLVNHFQKKFEHAPVEEADELLETQAAKTANQFKPIGLSNVIFKIFTKIITSRMSELMKKLISPQQVAYVKGRTIHEQVILASELVNEMKFKRRGGNISMKLDISQDYDTVSWEFLIKVLKKYCFSNDWCEWIITLFKSARISVLVNGGPCGFFKVERGLRQGDPLSPIIFVIMEYVFSKNISAMVEKRKMQSMVTKKGIHPTHLFFADDVFIFSNGGRKSLLNLL